MFFLHYVVCESLTTDIIGVFFKKIYSRRLNQDLFLSLGILTNTDITMPFDQFKRVRAFVFDVDGVFSDGSILVTESGDQLRKFNVRDGYAAQLAVKKGYPIAVITGGKSIGVQRRMNGLGIKDVYLGVNDKSTVLHDWLSGNQLTLADILYMGDDIPDLKSMKIAGFPACPSDAVEEIKAVSIYISPRKGGAGAVRDVIEKVMKLQGTWNEDTSVAST